MIIGFLLMIAPKIFLSCDKTPTSLYLVDHLFPLPFHAIPSLGIVEFLEKKKETKSNGLKPKRQPPSSQAVESWS